MNEEITQVQDDRKMIPVSPDTHRRVMAYAGKLTAARGARTSMDVAIVTALDIVESQLQTAPEPEAANA